MKKLLMIIFFCLLAYASYQIYDTYSKTSETKQAIIHSQKTVEEMKTKIEAANKKNEELKEKIDECQIDIDLRGIEIWTKRIQALKEEMYKEQ